MAHRRITENATKNRATSGQPMPTGLHIHRAGQHVTLSKALLVAGFLANIAMAFFSWQLSRTSQRAVDLANRPYIGLEGIGVHVDEDARRIDFNAMEKNFGTIPGGDFDLGWTVTSNGKTLPSDGAGTKPDTLFPGQGAVLAASMKGPYYQRILTGQDVIEFQVRATYTGPDGHYSDCVKARFVPEARAVENLGPCELT